MIQRDKILQLLEQGHITAEEAISLLKQAENNDTMQEAPHISKEAERSAREALSEDEFNLDNLFKNGTKILGEAFNLIRGGVETIKNTVESQPYVNITGKKAQSDVMNLTKDIQHLDISISQGAVKIVESNKVFQPTLRVEAMPYTGKKDDKAYYQLVQENDKLSIMSQHHLAKITVEILCPKNISFTDININASYGSIDLANIGCQHLNLSTTGGKITVHQVPAAKAQLTSVHGYIRYTDSLVGQLQITSVNGLIYSNVVANQLYTKTTNGRIEIFVAPQTQSVVAQTTMGQIVTTIAPQVLFTATAKTTLGSIDSLEDEQYSKLVNKSGKMNTLMMTPKHLTAQTTIDLETTCGQITLKYKD